MKPLLPLAAALLAVAFATPGLADRGKGKGHGWKPPHHAQMHCPPGLAKKSPACIPPGQAKKFVRRDRDDDDWRRHDRTGDRRDRHDWDRHVRVGDHIDHRWVQIHDPYRYGLDPDYYYYSALDRVFRVDPDTRQVMAFIGLLGALLN